MKLLDRYISKRVLQIYLLGQIAFIALYVFIDALLNFGKIEGPEGEAFYFTIVKYYLATMPDLFNMSSSFIFCLACIFALAMLEKNSQLIAIHASRISIFRILSLLLTLSLGFGGLQILNNCSLIPLATKTQIDHGWSPVKLDPKSPINYRDPTTIWTGLDKPTKVSQGISQIYIEGYDSKAKTFEGAHAMIMDQNSRPLVKIKGGKGKWDSNGTFCTDKVMCFSYEQGDRLYPYSKLNWTSKLPLESLYYSRFTKRSLDYSELSPFTYENTYASEQFYRLADGFIPFLMILISSVTALPFIYRKPLFSYFSCLVTTISVYMIYNSLKTEFAEQDLGFIYPISIISAICIGAFMFKSKKIPT